MHVKFRGVVRRVKRVIRYEFSHTDVNNRVDLMEGIHEFQQTDSNFKR